MPAHARGPSSTLRLTRDLLVGGYVGLVALGLVSQSQPRIFWTMLLPPLPVGIVLMGYYTWTICPLAFFGELGRRLKRGLEPALGLEPRTC